MKAVILAGGVGTRLRPLTFTRPKPALPVVNKPIIRHVLNLLKTGWLEKVIVALGYRGEVLARCLSNVDFINLELLKEDRPLGTAGCVGRVRDELNETFLVFSGDLITDVDVVSIVKAHAEHGGLVTMVLNEVYDTRHYGIAELDKDQRIVRFLEKPKPEEAFSRLANAGIYVLEPEVFKYIPRKVEVDFSRDVFPKMLKNEEKLYGYVHEGYWSDVGTLETYLSTNRDALSLKVHLEISARLKSEGLWMSEDAVIEEDVRITPPILIGRGSKVEKGAKLGSFTIIEDNVLVEGGVELEGSIILDGVRIGEGARVRESVIGSGCRLGVKCLLEMCVLGDDTLVGDGATIAPTMIRIAPSVSIPPHSYIHTDYMAP